MGSKNLLAFFLKCRHRLQSMFFAYSFKSFGYDSVIAGRSLFIGKSNISIGENTYIGQSCEIIALNNHFDKPLNSELSIGGNVRITARCRITCAGNVQIGDNCLIAPDVFITDHNHGMDPTVPGGYSPQPLRIRNVAIGNGCWLGQRVCVMPGTTIGKHSIIGANSVVTHDIPDYSIAAGSPARVLKRWNFEGKVWERV